MDRFVDLGDIADKLSAEFPAIRCMHLFGSRGFGTGSPRSDIDILLETDDYIRPEDLRRFSSGDLSALDLFLVDGGRATSTQNESYIEAKDSRSLIQSLKASKFWDRYSGRLRADISWKQRVRSDVTFVPTALPMNPKSRPEESIDMDTLRWGQVLRATSVRRIIRILVAIITVAALIFGAGYHVAQVLATSSIEKKSNR